MTKASLCRALKAVVFLGSASLGLQVSPLAAQSGPPPAPEAPQAVGMLRVPPDTAVSTVRDAIALALGKRGWTVVSTDHGSIVAHLRHRGIDSTLNFHYDERRIDIFSESFKVDDNGRPLTRLVPDRWIKFLEDDIRGYLLPAPKD
jgi:hypothetical protein